MKAERLTVISESGEKLGEFSKSEAITLAEDKGLDILQITFDKEPCVAKIIDYGKYKFDQKKKASLAKKNQKRLEQKEIKMRPNIGKGDIDVKLNKIKGFLDKKANVKVTVMFRGRSLETLVLVKLYLTASLKKPKILLLF